MAPTPHSFLTAPGEQRHGRWRALWETTGSGLLMLLTYSTMEGFTPSPPVLPLLLLSGAILVLLAVRRRYPITSLLGASAFLGALPAAGLPVAVIAYTTARQLASARRRTSVLFGATGLLVVVAAVVAPLYAAGSRSFGFGLGLVLAATTLLVPGLVGTARGQQDRLLRALGERAAAAEEARRLAESESRTHERSRIAAEMHDLVGHRLSLISLHSGGLEMALGKESPELRDEAALVRKATGDAMRELREVLGVLGPLGRDDTGTGALTDATGTRADIEALAEESRRVGIAVALTWDGPDLDVRPAMVRRAVHRVVRESLTNVHRYAPGSHVTVAVTHTDDRVGLLVRNGAPPSPPPATTGLGTGRGLTGLRERVSLLGGTLDAGPTASGGFAVTADIRPEPDPEADPADTGEPAPEPLPQPPPARSFDGFQRRAANALTGLLGLAGLAVLMLLSLALFHSARPGSPYVPPEDPRIGMSREEVEDAVGSDSSVVRAAATGREPARPDDVTRCVYPSLPGEHIVPQHVRDDPEIDAWTYDGAAHYLITRYCFRGDELAAIDRFTVPMVSQKPPWEAL
ncbi:sensor histidine kinase [Streptomyces zhaozhouensis]|nr:histidine kinase [Streptomyces zhaozhouensis]